MFNISRFSPGISKATFCGSSHVPRDASAVAVPGFCCFSGPDASDLVKQKGTKMPFFQVPSSGNDCAEMAKLQNPLFQRTLKDDPVNVSLVGQMLLFLVLPQASVSVVWSPRLICSRFLLEVSSLVVTALGLMGAPTRRLCLLVFLSVSTMVSLRMLLQVR